MLQNTARLEEAANTVYTALYDAPESALAQMRLAVRRLEDLLRIDPRLEAAREGLAAAVIAIEEASYAVRDYLSHLEANPARLEEIESRLAALERLRRKYGATAEEILAFLDQVRGEIESGRDRRRAQGRARRASGSGWPPPSKRLPARSPQRRKDAARKLEKRVETELASLAMERTSSRWRSRPAAWSETGIDAVQFLVSPNVGEEPRPLEKVASGGEISRIALALKTCVASAARRTERIHPHAGLRRGGRRHRRPRRRNRGPPPEAAWRLRTRCSASRTCRRSPASPTTISTSKKRNPAAAPWPRSSSWPATPAPAKSAACSPASASPGRPSNRPSSC